MTRQRRSHLLILALVPVVVFAAVRCADSTATAPATQVAPATAPPDVAARLTKLRQETDWIGQFHNDALAYVLASVSRVPAKSRDRRAVCEAARKAYAEFHRSRRGKAMPEAVDSDFESFCAAGSRPTSRSVSLDPSGGERKAEVSADAQNLMDQIASSISPSISYDDLSARVYGIEAAAAETLSYDEALDVVTVGTVTLNSASYWATSIPDWIPFSNTADYNQLLATRVFPAGETTSPAFKNWDDGGWSAFAGKVWNDAKAAAKRAAVGDARAAIKAAVGAGVAGSPIIYEIVISVAAAGSIMSVLQM